jgi:hypothetical protein
VRPTQTCGHRLFVPGLGRANDSEAVWELGAVTQGAVQRGSNAPRALSVVQHPRGTSKRRIVANVLAVEAIEMCDPVAGVVSAESEDRPFHDRSVGGAPSTHWRSWLRAWRTFVIIGLALCTKSIYLVNPRNMVRRSASDDGPLLDEGIGPAAVVGTLVGFIAVFLFGAGVMLLAGSSPGGAASVGVFAGFWGGPGLGGMFGATIQLARHEALSLVESGHDSGPRAAASRGSSDELAQTRARAA